MQNKFIRNAKKSITANENLRSLSLAGKSSLAKFGAYGEILAQLHLEFLGYSVEYTGQSSVGYDLLVENALKVEVKTARKSKDGIWQASLTKIGHSDISKSDLVLFQCVIELGHVITFAIPTSEIVAQKQIKITSHPTTYNGKYAQWRVQ